MNLRFWSAVKSKATPLVHEPASASSLLVQPSSRLPLGPLAIGLSARFAIAPYTSWSNDAAVWFHTGLAGFYGVDLYGRPGFSYPPLWGYCLQILGAAIHLIGVDSAFFGLSNPDFQSASSATNDFSVIVTSPMFNVLFKAVLFGFDLLTAIIVFKLVVLLTGNARAARLAFIVWFLNPFVIYESAVEGAADTLVGFFVLATITLILRGRAFWGGAAWMTGILVKLSPIVLGLILILALVIHARDRKESWQVAAVQLVRFGLGSILAAICILAPELVSGSISAMLLNIFHRTQGSIAIGGLSITGIRHLRQFSWLLPWAYQNSAFVVRASFIAQAAACIAWTAWALITMRRNIAFGLLTGTVGILASLMLLAPISQPPYVIWWLPELIVVATLTHRGYWQLFLLSLAPLVFSLGVLGPYAVLAPLATYTHLLPTSTVVESVIQWYTSPGKLWGPTLPDDFFAAAALTTVAALVSLFAVWMRTAIQHRELIATAP